MIRTSGCRDYSRAPAGVLRDRGGEAGARGAFRRCGGPGRAWSQAPPTHAYSVSRAPSLAGCGTAEAKPERKARSMGAVGVRGLGRKRGRPVLGCRVLIGAPSPARCATAEARPERKGRWRAAAGLRGLGYNPPPRSACNLLEQRRPARGPQDGGGPSAREGNAIAGVRSRLPRGLDQ
jgi:hypothetical protein